MQTTQPLTIRQHLHHLFHPYRNLAIKNLEEQKQVDGNDTCATLSEAIRQAFDWEKTPQGHAFWGALYDRVKSAQVYDNDRLPKHLLYFCVDMQVACKDLKGRWGKQELTETMLHDYFSGISPLIDIVPILTPMERMPYNVAVQLDIQIQWEKANHGGGVGWEYQYFYADKVFNIIRAGYDACRWIPQGWAVTGDGFTIKY